MKRQRLSSLDASFLEVESPSAHMHVGWVALMRPPADAEAPTFNRIRDHVAGRLSGAPRYRQKLAPIPLGLHDPMWVDDPGFDIRRHVRHSEAHSIDRLAEQVFSTQLHRDRPLWELWIADRLDDGRIGVVGKVHHCMVDGIAAVELASLFLDPSPEPRHGEHGRWEPAAQPGRLALLGEAVRDRVGDEISLLRVPVRSATSPRKMLGMLADTRRAARSLAHSLLPAAPPSRLNEPISRYRTLARTRRPLDDLRAIRRQYGVTINDVVLAVAAGAVRRHLQRHGDTPLRLKAMVPVNVRGDDSAGDLGNRVSFLFVELPCDEPDPVRRLEDIHVLMTDRKAAGEPRGSEAVLAALGYAPHVVQHVVSHAVASPRTFNLVVSNIPGPRQRLYMLGCPMEEAYPIVPMADRHSVSIGFTTVVDEAFFGIYADPKRMPDARLLARDVERSIDELLTCIAPTPG